MEAAQAPVGQGPLRPAEGKEPKALQAEISRLMASCEKLRARKRFFANKVEEITNPSPAPPGPSLPTPAGPLLVLPEPTGAGAAQPSSADVSSPASRDCLAQAVAQMHTRTDAASLPSSNQMNVVESPPPTTTHASTPTPPIQTAPPGSEPPAQAAVVPAVTVQGVGMGVADDTAVGSHCADGQPADAGHDASHQECRQTAQGSAQPDGHHLSRQGHHMQGIASNGTEEACIRRPDSSQGEGRRTAAEALLLPSPAQQAGQSASAYSMQSSKAQSQPASRPGFSHSMHSAQQAQRTQRAQQLSGRSLSLLWGDGVRAPAGAALAIGPWAHTSGTMPVTTQAIPVDVGDFDFAGRPEHQSDWLSRQQSESCTKAQAAGNACTGQQASLMEVDDQAEAAQEAADRAETDPAATTRAATPTPEGPSNASQMCNVCLCPIRQLIIVLQPCGHYYCENCTAAIRAVAYPRCPECRTRISSTFRVPLSSSHNQTHREDAQHAQVGHTVCLSLLHWHLDFNTKSLSSILTHLSFPSHTSVFLSEACAEVADE